jgi:phospholipid/cholesterol/gamma-HCH transport system ATP-binding protein
VTVEASLMQDHIRLREVCMRFGSDTVLEAVSLTLERGRIGVIIGGSGAGKTTLMRIIVGLLRPSAGEVWIDGENIAAMRERELQRARAKWAVVFQYSALLDSLSVLQNVMLPLDEHERALKPAERKRRALELLESLELSGAEDRYPDELSGGMRKRVALARALVRRPSLIVYDEPASGLDPLTARLVDDLIVRTRDRFGVTSLVITHDMAEASRLADALYVLDKGRLVAQGPPQQLRAEAGSLAARFFAASGIE